MLILCTRSSNAHARADSKTSLTITEICRRHQMSRWLPVNGWSAKNGALASLQLETASKCKYAMKIQCIHVSMLCYGTLTSTPVYFTSLTRRPLQKRTFCLHVPKRLAVKGRCWASQMLTQVEMSMLHFQILTQLAVDILIQKWTLDSASIATNFRHVTVT